MLTLQDCIGFCGLTPDQLEAVAHHHRMAPVVAAEWAEMMLDRDDGVRVVEAALIEEVAAACAHGDTRCADRYRQALTQFRRDYTLL